MSYDEKELINQFAKNPNIKITEDVQNTIKSLFSGLIQQMFEAEIEEYLGYSKYDYINKNTKKFFLLRRCIFLNSPIYNF